MEAKLSFLRSVTLGAIAILLIPLSACVESSDRSVQTAQVDSTPNAGIPREPEEKIRLEGLRFGADGARLHHTSKPILNAAAEILKSEPDEQIYVIAYGDPTGGKRASRWLAQQRAEKVKAYLETQGIPSERMIARGVETENVGTPDGTKPVTRKENPKVELIPFTNRPASTTLASSAPAAGSLN